MSVNVVFRQRRVGETDTNMRFEILGPLRVTHGGPVPLTGQRRRILLLALLAHPSRVVPTAELVDWLWPHRPPRSALATLQAHVSALRRVIEPDRPPWQAPDRLLTHPSGYLLCVEPDELDAIRLERLVDAAKPALDAGEAELACRLATEALALWRGPALADAAHVDAARSEIARLEELRLTAAAVRVESCFALDRHLDVIPDLSRLVAKHPLHERFYAQLMVALARAGRRADALAVYRRARAVLARELHVGPGKALRCAEAAILSGEID
jgi:SARP family transcriptional regulator, regulator of embCAB operon